MKKGCLIWIIIGAVIALIVFGIISWGIKVNNRMVALQEGVTSQWGNVETQYQRRADLIPNFVNTVKGAAQFEQETLTQVIEARAKATQVTLDPTKMTAENMKQFQEVQGEVSSALSRLMVVVEKYPSLKRPRISGIFRLHLKEPRTGSPLNAGILMRKQRNSIHILSNSRNHLLPG